MAFRDMHKLVFVLAYCVIVLGQQQDELSQAFKYMMRYGYLADLGPNSEALYAKKGITDAIKKMQSFGGLVATGELDKATLALFTKPRCGVQDVEPETNLRPRIRNKRYVIASDGWQKESLTYKIGSFPQHMPKSTVSRKLREAFEVWSKISPLRFHETNSKQADMDVLFERRHHDDKYPFDGPGNVLAHAFFPHRTSTRGGDVHFDDEEKWADLSSEDSTDIDAVDFYTVAAHEIGHALGLAHSNDTEALMFPYYKGYTSPSKIIGNDDILAMEELYITRQRNDVNRFNEKVTTRRPHTRRTTPKRRVYSTRRPITRTRPSKHPHTPTTRPTRRPTRVTRPTVRPTISNKRGEHEHGAMELPNLCEGSFDAMSMIRGELMIFKKRFMWRFREKARLSPGYPVEFRRFFYKFPTEISKIDAIYERITDGKIVFFTGPEYWVYDGLNFIENSPQPLSKLGLPPYIQKVDAALHRSSEKITYFFIRNSYFTYNETAKCLTSRYPNKISRTTGLQPDVDNAFEWKDGKSYIFKGKHFWRLKDGGIKVEEQVSNRMPQVWAGCR